MSLQRRSFESLDAVLPHRRMGAKASTKSVLLGALKALRLLQSWSTSNPRLALAVACLAASLHSTSHPGLPTGPAWWGHFGATWQLGLSRRLRLTASPPSYILLCTALMPEFFSQALPRRTIWQGKFPEANIYACKKRFVAIILRKF